MPNIARDGVAATPTPTPGPNTPPAAGPGTRIAWGDGSWYLFGANVPWYNWGCDFGCGNDGGGVSDPSVSAAIGPVFAQAKASGLVNIRWWMFEDKPWQITTGGNGAPTGIEPAVYADIDAALKLADTYGLYYDFVLFSAPSALPESWMTDPGQRSELARVLGQLAAHFKDNKRVMTWEVFNEPESEMWSNAVDPEAVQATVKEIAAAIHANSNAYVTVGALMLDGLNYWVGQGLDYYQAHWYDYMSSGGYCARCSDYATERAKYQLDKPLVIGEFWAGEASDALQRFTDFYEKGYAGAWAWSLFPNQTSDLMDIDLAAAKEFASQHSDIGPP